MDESARRIDDERHGRRMRRGAARALRALGVAAAIGAGALGSATAGAQAADPPPAFDVLDFQAAVRDASGELYTQAGGRPFQATTSFAITTMPGVGVDTGLTVPVEDMKTITTSLPPGFMGNPQAAPKCTSDNLPDVTCPVDSQIGVATVALLGAPPFEVPVYNLVGQPGHPAEFGFKAGGLGPVHLFANVRSNGDYGLDVVAPDTAQANVVSVSLTLWGVPADPRHDAQRVKCYLGGFLCTPGQVNNTRPQAFLSNPTNCDAAPPVTTLSLNTWQSPATFLRVTAASPTPTGCDELEFEPTLQAEPATTQAGAPSGYTVRLRVPQSDEPEKLATSPLKEAVVNLPQGVTLNASVADGLGGCTDAQFDEHSGRVDNCPASAKLGTVQITSPVIDHPLNGSIYLRQPDPGADINSLYSVFLSVADPQTGVIVKIRGQVVPDATTGQLTARFANNPQLPFSELVLQFKGGPRAPLSNPKTCGTHVTSYALTSWSGATKRGESRMSIDGNCAAATAFSPTMAAGVVDPTAGRSSAFTLTVDRPDGQPALQSLDVGLPRGLLGRVGSVPLCPEAQAATGTCDSASQVGRTTVASGTGASPVFIPQPGKAPTAVYLAGPYKGAPFSLSIVVPAQAGPFDLGNVVVRAALFIDSHDAHVTVQSDPLPTTLQGVPLNIQKLNVTMDRPGFMVSPTSCQPMQVQGAVRSDAGQAVNVASRFRMGDCSKLRFAPKLDLSLSGPKKELAKGGHPSLTATVRQTRNEANVSNVQVKLPLLLSLDTENAQALCEYSEGIKERPNCPRGSIVGQAKVVTPVLNQPLTGPVYFVKNERRSKQGRQIKTLPMLVIPLRGQGVELTLRAPSAVSHNQLVSTFENVPDAPITRFDMQLTGGRYGILEATGAVCSRSRVAAASMLAQSGRRLKTSPTIKAKCSGKSAAKKESAKARGAKAKAPSAKRGTRAR